LLLLRRAAAVTKRKAIGRRHGDVSTPRRGKKGRPCADKVPHRRSMAGRAAAAPKGAKSAQSAKAPDTSQINSPERAERGWNWRRKPLKLGDIEKPRGDV